MNSSDQTPPTPEKSVKNPSRSLDRSQIFLIATAVVIIIFTIVIVAELQTPLQEPFSKIITVGPTWSTNSWSCTSDANFMIYGTLRGLEGSSLAVSISGIGTQSLYSFNAGQMETFSVGAPADHTIVITKTGTITGFLTLQTTSNAKASCIQS